MSSGPKILRQQVMTGAGQRMPTQQAIILRPGQQGGGLVSLPGGGQARQQPIMVNSPSARVQGPGLRANCTLTSNRNVVINQPGSAAIHVPLQTLQSMQPGQGIPTGQAGHLLVKTENGQYQILRVQSSPSVPASTASPGVTAVSNATQIVRSIATPAAVVRTQSQTSAPIVAVSRPPASVMRTAVPSVVSASPSHHVAARTSTPMSNSAGGGGTSGSGGIGTTAGGGGVSAATAAAAGAGGGSAAGGGSGGGGAGAGGGTAGMGTQMTPDTAKHKCKNFLATLLRLAGEQPQQVRVNVRQLIQGLIDNRVNPEDFTTKLQKELNSSPQPCLVPFLRRSLPYLQQSLLNGELSIEGVNPPPRSSTINTPSVIRGVANTVQRPQIIQRPPIMRTINPNSTANATAVSGMIRTLQTPKVITTAGSAVAGAGGIIQKQFVQGVSGSGVNTSTSLAQRVGALNNLGGTPTILSSQVKKEKSNNSYSVTGDEDINDVAAMGGVNIAEESQRMQGTIVAGTQIRSCKDETFLQTGLLHKRMARLCREQGLDEPSSDVIALVSHATQDRLKTLLEKLSVISEHRLDIVRQEGDYEVTQDVKGQLRFLGELDKIERRRHEEAERELLYRAMKSRTKNEDQEKLKAKGKELQRLEQEQQSYEKANSTALMAIGGPRKMLKLDGDQLSSAAPTAPGTTSSTSSATAAGGGTSMQSSRSRTKRVHVRDLVFLMEQEKDLKRSPLLWKAYCS